MYNFFEFIADFLNDLVDALNMYAFNIGGISVTLWGILLGFLCLSIIISLFWKGGRG